MQQSSIESPYLTFEESMAYLRVSRTTMYRLLNKGQLTGYKVNWQWRFLKEDLDKCIVPARSTPPLPERRLPLEYIEIPDILF